MKRMHGQLLFACLGILCLSALSCSGSNSNSVGPSSNSGSGSGQSPTTSVTFTTPPPPTVVIYPNPSMTTWNGVLVTPRALGCDTLGGGFTGPLVVTTASISTGTCTFENLVFGLPAPNTAVAYLGINAAQYVNGTVRFDVVSLNALVDHFVVLGDQGQVSYTPAGVGTWTTYRIPVSQLYGDVLGHLPYALQISFDIASSNSPFGTPAGFPSGTSIAEINNLQWCPTSTCP